MGQTSQPQNLNPNLSGRDAGGTTWFEPYRQPLAGQIQIGGETVDVFVLQIGDKPGASDVFKCVDARNGLTATVKAEHVRITAIAAPAGSYVPLGAIVPQQLR